MNDKTIIIFIIIIYHYWFYHHYYCYYYYFPLNRTSIRHQCLTIPTSVTVTNPLKKTIWFRITLKED